MNGLHNQHLDPLTMRHGDPRNLIHSYRRLFRNIAFVSFHTWPIKIRRCVIQHLQHTYPPFINAAPMNCLCGIVTMEMFCLPQKWRVFWVDGYEFWFIFCICLPFGVFSGVVFFFGGVLGCIDFPDQTKPFVGSFKDQLRCPLTSKVVSISIMM